MMRSDIAGSTAGQTHAIAGNAGQTQAIAGNAGQTQAIAIRKVTIEESGAWLAAGWNDVKRAPLPSLAYGLAFVLISHLLFFGLTALDLGSLILPLVGGFMLIGPLAAVGFYEISRRIAQGQPVMLETPFLAWREHADQIALIGVALLVAMFAWIQVALILFAMFFQGAPPTLADFAGTLVASWDNLPFLVIGTAAGGVMAAAVFAVSVVSMPMLLDRDVTAAEAIAASLMAAKANWRVMIGWAATIALITGFGIATFFFGLALALPLVGHASWHAYKSLVR